MRIELGSKVIDKLTGIKGIAIGRTEWLHGCVRISIQPYGQKDGKPLEVHSADEQSVECIEPKKVKKSRIGGPHPEPARRKDPSR